MSKAELLEIAKPILFNTEMVRAIQDGRKVQTRRVVFPQPLFKTSSRYILPDDVPSRFSDCDDFIAEASKYKIGDILWVREPAKVIQYNNHEASDDWAVYSDGKIINLSVLAEKHERVHDILYEKLPKWFVKCHGIPNGCIKEMARIFLKVTDVMVERLQDITFEDIFREGFKGEIKDYFITTKYKDNAITANTVGELEILNWWISLWNSTAKDGYKWEDNPYVFINDFMLKW